MKILRLLSILVPLLICFQASAISTPARLHPLLTDTTLAVLPIIQSAAPVQSKKTGFFGKLKNKLLSVVINSQPEEKKTSVKRVLGWISLGMVVLGLGLLALSVSGPAVGVLFFGGLLAGLVSLFIPRSKEEKEAKKKNTGGIIALVLGIGVILALAIAFASSSWH